jgi:hypothetical protein
MIFKDVDYTDTNFDFNRVKDYTFVEGKQPNKFKK